MIYRLIRSSLRVRRTHTLPLPSPRWFLSYYYAFVFPHVLFNFYTSFSVFLLLAFRILHHPFSTPTPENTSLTTTIAVSNWIYRIAFSGASDSLFPYLLGLIFSHSILHLYLGLPLFISNLCVIQTHITSI